MGLAASSIATVEVAADPSTIPADGVSTSTITATVRDDGGTPVADGAMVGFTTTLAYGTLPYEHVEAEDASEVTAPGWLTSSATFFGPPSGGEYIYVNTVGATASWIFTGTAVSLRYGNVYTGGYASGVVTVTLGNPPFTTTIDMADPAASDGNAWVEEVITGGLSLAQRVITVEVASLQNVTGYIRLDAFRSGTTTSDGKAEAILTSESLTTTAVADVWATGVNLGSNIIATTSVTLSVPGPPYTLTVEAYPTTILADGVSTSTITATVQDELGDPVSDGTVVTFKTYVGTLNGSWWVTKTTASGVATATLTSMQAGIASVWIYCADKFDWVSVNCMPGPPYAVTVIADPTTIPVDGYSSTIKATVVDRYWNHVDPVAVAFATSLGTIFPLTDTTSDGEAFSTLTSGSTPGTATVTATAASRVGNALVTFKFIPGPPYTVTVVADPTTILIGSYTSTIKATVVDGYGNRVDPVTVAFTTSLGTILPLMDTTIDGEAFGTLTSGSTPGIATVTATAASRVGNALVTFVTRIFLPLITKSYTP